MIAAHTATYVTQPCPVRPQSSLKVSSVPIIGDLDNKSTTGGTLASDCHDVLFSTSEQSRTLYTARRHFIAHNKSLVAAFRAVAASLPETGLSMARSQRPHTSSTCLQLPIAFR